MTIADYCAAMDRGEIVVNRDYQRSDKVWPDVARSYLIETMLKGFPVPKLWLHQIVDPKSKKGVKEVVDGQQRTFTISEFFQNRLRLSAGLELETAAGKTYDELDDELKVEFLNYPLAFDLFVSTSGDEVREVFRRINSYTVPLNGEEHRHAVYQGQFKWFINRLSRTYAEAFLGMGTFSEKQLVRMQDAKLLTEITHALLEGITTTRRTTLDALYKDKDKEFPEESDLEERLTRAFDQLVAWNEIHQTALMKPYVVYSLVLAVAHLQSRVGALNEDFDAPRIRQFDDAAVQRNLLVLADAVENPDQAGDLSPFVEASSSRTNVADQRRKRFQWFCRALTDDL